MNNQSLINKGTGTDRFGKALRLRSTWHLMIVNEFGRAIRLGYLKRYLVIMGVVLITVFLAALFFAVLFISERSERVEMRSSLAQSQAKVSSLIDENDALIARLAVLNAAGPTATGADRDKAKAVVAEEEVSAEEKVEKTDKVEPVKKVKPVEVVEPVKKVEPVKPVEAVEVVEVVEPVKKAEPAKNDAGADQPAAGAAIAFEKFRFLRHAGTDTVNVDFMVRKQGVGQSPVSGRVFVVLKGKSDQGDRYLVIPEVPLVDGRPLPPDRGQSFSFERFRTIKMSARADRPEEFNQATVLAYTPDGEIIQENVFPVSVIEAAE